MWNSVESSPICFLMSQILSPEPFFFPNSFTVNQKLLKHSQQAHKALPKAHCAQPISSQCAANKLTKHSSRPTAQQCSHTRTYHLADRPACFHQSQSPAAWTCQTRCLQRPPTSLPRSRSTSAAARIPRSSDTESRPTAHQLNDILVSAF